MHTFEHPAHVPTNLPVHRPRNSGDVDLFYYDALEEARLLPEDSPAADGRRSPLYHVTEAEVARNRSQYDVDLSPSIGRVTTQAYVHSETRANGGQRIEPNGHAAEGRERVRDFFGLLLSPRKGHAGRHRASRSVKHVR